MLKIEIGAGTAQILEFSGSGRDLTDSLSYSILCVYKSLAAHDAHAAAAFRLSMQSIIASPRFWSSDPGPLENIVAVMAQNGPQNE